MVDVNARDGEQGLNRLGVTLLRRKEQGSPVIQLQEQQEG